MQKIWKVAVIGAGDMGKEHVNGWTMSGHEVVSITDIDTDRATALAQEFGVKTIYSDYKQAITDANVEIVSVCLPLALHAPVTIFAAEQGKHIFCEKPLARNFQEALAMEEAVTKAGVQFGIGFQRNQSRALHKAKEIVQEGKIGRPVVFYCDNVAQIRPKRVMHDADGNAGPMMDMGCHYYIMWQTVFGSKPKTVYARGKVLAKERPELTHIQRLAYDTGVVTVEYETGDIGVYTVSWGMAPNFKMKGNANRIYGPKGGLEGGFNSNAKKLTYYEEDQVSELQFEAYPSLHAEQFSRFVDALNQGKPAPVSFGPAKDVLALTLAIFHSIDTGTVVDFPSFYEEITRKG